MHTEKTPNKLLKSIKGLTFKEKEYVISLVKAIDKLYRI
jgi:hypothetical protein